MLKPSIDELLGQINSRFALTIVIAKRARQLQLSPDDYKVKYPVGQDSNEVAKSLEELHSYKLEYYLDAESAQQAAQESEMNTLESVDELSHNLDNRLILE